MELQIVRKVFTEKTAIGDFIINGEWRYYSLEDKDRQIRQDGSLIQWSRTKFRLE